MMFSSRPPFNDDPTPWAIRRWDANPRPRSDHPDFDAPEWFDRENSADYLPRPDFDRPQSNPVNPILADFRDMAGNARMWLDVIQSDDGDAFLAGTPKAFGRVTADHIVHVIRVLTRLANFTNDKEN